ncbi:23S rRNA (adenine(1618)-N(6))-methyltransferase RlmF [Pseudomonas sp. NPDC090202]|uniref:23S rRNA (adenine(1618)-N(6))-methyltransferase RlmF n=1 Tax=unclassified Pseudomonas TaxID=196821 RepID=UPI00380654DB
MTTPDKPKPPRKRPKPAKPAAAGKTAAAPREKASLHPRNRHQGHYDFPRLIKGSPELGKFVITNPYGKESIDFADPAAVRVFNRALLKAFYGIAHWDIPADYLCPPIPGRADYLHFLADLLAEHNDGVIPRGAMVKALDIGTGANCVYPLIGHSEYGWYFVGSDIDKIALASASTIVKANNLHKAIALRQQDNRQHILSGLLQADERYDVTLCNPPFHASAEEALRGSQRKWRALGKADPKRKLPVLNFGGQAAELWCEGGEARFVSQLISESALVANQVLWFSTLVSKASNLPLIESALKKAGAVESRVVDMSQGQKQSRFVAWTFQDKTQQQAWRAQRWGGNH